MYTSPSHRVLIVEDDKVDAMAIERAFKRNYPDAMLIHVENGQEALNALKSKPYPDLILMDIRMPILDGREALHAIKKDAHLKLIPVIMTSTSSDERDVKYCYENHANGYIVKPNTTAASDSMVQSIAAFWFQNCIMAHTSFKPV